MLDRRTLLAVAGTAVPAAAGLAAGGKRKRPNVVLIVTDDQGPQAGYLGTAGLRTPNMDRLARRGMVFTKAFCTYPSCSPARASIMTGAYPHTHRIERNVHEHMGKVPPKKWRETKGRMNRRWGVVPADLPTLPEIMNRAGYRTAIDGKFHMAPHDKFPFDRWLTHHGDPERVAQFLDGVGDRPFFLFFNTRSPHRPFGHFTRGQDPVDPRETEPPDLFPDTPVCRKDWAAYLTAITHADGLIGKLLDVLEQKNLIKDTLVIFVGDNGPAYPRAKGTVYSPGLWTPMVISGPGIRTGRRDGAVSHVDIMPTILDFAGLPTPDTAAGRSLRPLLTGAPPDAGTRCVFGQEEKNMWAATDGKWYYIRRDLRPGDRGRWSMQKPRGPADCFGWGNLTWAETLRLKAAQPRYYRLMEILNDPPAEELFDLDADPWCTRDLAKDARVVAALKRMRGEMDRWRKGRGCS